jgi:transmembrane sensor
MDYDQFQAEDLLTDESFLRYCLGTDDKARIFWENWLQNHPGKQDEVIRAKQIYSIINGGNSKQSFEMDKAKFLQRLKTEGIMAGGMESARVVGLVAETKQKRKIPVYSLLAAAVILSVIFIGGYFLLDRDDTDKVMGNTTPPPQSAEQIVPGGDRAILTLSNGNRIVLDSVANGDIAQQGGVKVIKIDGRLNYNQETNTTEVLYNTVTTPKGGQYQLVLADNSRVWLNAGSSLRFPTSFPGDDRRVELTGEGYFEVAHHAEKPFLVAANGMEVKVLGTRFNVNAYTEEKFLATLIEGSVLVSAKSLSRSAMLTPGQQAIVDNTSLTLNKEVDTDEVIGWKNGLFIFNMTPIEEVMKQISRWYDVEISYEGKTINKNFTGIIKRNNDIDAVLKVIEQAGIRFRIDGKKITVLQ